MSMIWIDEKQIIQIPISVVDREKTDALPMLAAVLNKSDDGSNYTHDLNLVFIRRNVDRMSSEWKKKSLRQTAQK